MKKKKFINIYFLVCSALLPPEKNETIILEFFRIFWNQIQVDIKKTIIDSISPLWRTIETTFLEFCFLMKKKLIFLDVLEQGWENFLYIEAGPRISGTWCKNLVHDFQKEGGGNKNFSRDIKFSKIKFGIF